MLPAFHGRQVIFRPSEEKQMRGVRRDTTALHWALLPLLAGVIIGVSLSTFFLLQPYTSITNIYLQLPSQEETSAPSDHFDSESDLRRLLSELRASHFDSRGITKLADEANAKAPVYYAVVMKQRHSAEQLKVLAETWTKDVSPRDINYFIRSEEKTNEGLTEEEMQDEHYGEIEHKENVIEVSSRARELFPFEVISHVCRNRVNSSKWILLVEDSVYVKSKELENRLQRYENIPAYGYLGRRGENGEEECSEEAGVILSHQVLSVLCQRLSVCRDEKKAISGCLTSKLSFNCNQLPPEGELHFLSLEADLKGSITEKSNARALQSAMIISSVPDAKTMFSIHQAVVGGRLNSTQYEIHALKSSLDRMTELIPSLHHRLSDVHREGSEVVSIDDVLSWKLVHNNELLSDEEFSPTRGVPGVWREELDSMIEKAVQYISTKDNAQHVYNRVVNAYWRVDPLIGINYMVDLETRKLSNGISQTNRHRATFIRPLNRPEISHTLSQVANHVTIVVCFTSEEIERLQLFLQRLQSVLDRDQRISLIAIQMRSSSEKQRPRRGQSNFDPKSIFSLYTSKYQSASFSLLESPALLSRSHAISIVLRESRPSDLLFLGDLDLQFEEGFLERCRSLPLQGQQAYFPMAFSLRDPTLLSSLNHSLIEGTVSRHAGHWLVESFSIACIYAADLQALSSQSDSKGVLNDLDMEEVYRVLLKKGYEVIRAPDKQLKRVYHSKRLCDLDLIGQIHGESCQQPVEFDEPQYLQTQLSALLFDHEGANSAYKY